MRARSLLAAALLLAACGSGGEQQTTQPTASTGPATTAGASDPASETETTPAPTTGAAVPDILDFSAETVRGDQIAGADYAGQDLVLWFWAPW